MEIQLSGHIIFSLPDFTSKNDAAGAPTADPPDSVHREVEPPGRWVYKNTKNRDCLAIIPIIVVIHG